MILVLITKEFSWLSVFTIFIVGQMLTYWLAIPSAEYLNLRVEWWPGLSLCIGIFGMFFAGGLIFIFKNFSSNPWATLSNAVALWRGTRDRGTEDHPK